MESVAYTFDNIYQLKEEKRLDSSSNMVYDILWDYDEVGNRKYQEKTVGTGTMIRTDYMYNNANQLITEQVTGETNATTYTYDANGNQTKKTKGNDEWNWTYNYDNMQIAYDDPINTNDTTYAYDAYGRRISRTNTSSQASERYLYDGANVIADYDGSNNLVATYVTPFLDQNLVKTIGTDKYYYFQDGLGSVRNIIDSTQTVKNTYDYMAFGESYGTITAPVANRYMYTGREWDAESSTYHYRTRQYHPQVGRFGQKDHIIYSYDVNPYTYVTNNPVIYGDPLGKWKFELTSDGRIRAIPVPGEDNSSGKLRELLDNPVNYGEIPEQYRESVKQYHETQYVSPMELMDYDLCNDILPDLEKDLKFDKDILENYKKFDGLKEEEKSRTAKEAQDLVGTWIQEKYAGIGKVVVTGGVVEKHGLVQMAKNVYVRPDKNPLSIQATRVHEEKHNKERTEITVSAMAKWRNANPKSSPFQEGTTELRPEIKRDALITSEISAYGTNIKYLEDTISQIKKICEERKKQ